MSKPVQDLNWIPVNALIQIVNWFTHLRMWVETAGMVLSAAY